MSGSASFLGYVPVHTAPGKPDMEVDDPALQSLVEELDLSTPSLEDVQAAREVEVHAEIQVGRAPRHGAVVLLLQ